MYLTDHGGACCGINHIHGFPPIPNRIRVRELQRLIRESKDSVGLLEIVLTEGQKTGWHEVLIAEGFVLKTRARNPNTGNIINVYHKIMRVARGPAFVDIRNI